jgi:hypothetical protein
MGIPAVIHCYIAGKSRHWPWVAALGIAGVPITCTWPSWLPNRTLDEPEPHQWREHAQRCIDEAADCDVLILYVEDGEQHFGALLEAGAALGAGREVFLVSPKPWAFLRNHPRCRSFDNLAEAIRAVVSLQAGERARTLVTKGN